MIDAFKALDKDKQQQILEAAFEEFTNEGYQKASTNKIIEKAGISKGLLFYYFKNKEGLKNYLTNYSIELIENEYINKISIKQTDFIEKLKELSKLKITVYQQNKYVFNYLTNIILKEDKDKYSKEIMQRMKNIQNHMNSYIYENNDHSHFRKDIPNDELMKIIRYCLAGCEHDYTYRAKNEFSSGLLEKMVHEFDDILNYLKQILYDN